LPDAELETRMPRAEMMLPANAPFLAMVPRRSPEAAVRDRVNAWCNAWSSETCATDMETLRPLLGKGALHMMNDFGSDIALSDSFDTYQAVWMPVLPDTFRNWHLVLASDVDLRVSQSLASAAYFTVFEGETHQGTRMVQRQAVSTVWEMQGGEWRLVHEHTSIDSEGRMA
jgi:ketosteroid isomerase-like protein